MALQTSGAISLLDIQNEFGGSNPISLSEYYGAASGIPASGTISLSNFYGASAGWTLTQGTNNNVYGFSTSSSLGSISPTTLNGATINSTYYYYLNVKGTISHIFFVILDGNRTQNFFTSVSEASLGTKSTSSATTYQYQSSNNTTLWSWNLTSAPANWDGSGDLTVVFV